MTAIENLIPQRAPMIMIDDLVVASADKAVTNYSVKENNVFLTDNGYFNESGLVENIAQTAAAQAGYMAHINGIPPAVGFIAAINALEVYDLPCVNSTVETKVTVTNRVFDVVIIEGTVEQNEKLLCRCKMKIFIKP